MQDLGIEEKTHWAGTNPTLLFSPLQEIISPLISCQIHLCDQKPDFFNQAFDFFVLANEKFFYCETRLQGLILNAHQFARFQRLLDRTNDLQHRQGLLRGDDLNRFIIPDAVHEIFDLLLVDTIGVDLDFLGLRRSCGVGAPRVLSPLWHRQ